MARKRKPCEFCENEHFYNDGSGMHCLQMEFYPGHLINICSAAPDVSEETELLEAEIPFNYCPACGRDLTDVI